MILRERLDSQPWDFTQCFTSILAHREAFRLRLGYLLIYQIRQALDHYLFSCTSTATFYLRTLAWAPARHPELLDSKGNDPFIFSQV